MPKPAQIRLLPHHYPYNKHHLCPLQHISHPLPYPPNTAFTAPRHLQLLPLSPDARQFPPPQPQRIPPVSAISAPGHIRLFPPMDSASTAFQKWPTISNLSVNTSDNFHPRHPRTFPLSCFSTLPTISADHFRLYGSSICPTGSAPATDMSDWFRSHPDHMSDKIRLLRYLYLRQDPPSPLLGMSAQTRSLHSDISGCSRLSSPLLSPVQA